MIKSHNLIIKYRSLSIPVKAGFWFTVSGFIQKAIGFLTLPLFTRLLNSEEYGAVTVYNSWENIFFLLVTLNVFYGVFNTAMMDFEKEKDSYTSSLTGFIIAMGLVWLAFYTMFSSYVNPLTGMTTLMSCVMLCQIVFQGVFSVWLAKCKFDYEYVPVVVSSLVFFLLSPILSIIGIVLFPDNKVLAKIIGHATAYLLIGCYAGICILRNDYRLMVPRYWVYAISLSAPLLLHYIATVILGQSDRIMISKFESDSKAAIYAVAYSVSMMFSIFTTAACQAIVPKLYKCIKANELYIIHKHIKLLLVASILSLSILMLIGPEIIKILAPPDYYESIWLIPPVMASLFFMFLYQLFANIEFYYKQISYIISASVIAAILNILLNYSYIPIYGYRAAAYTTLICYAIFGTFHFVYARKVAINNGIDWPFSIKFIFLLIIPLFFVSAFSLLLYLYPIIRFSILTIAAIYAIMRYRSIIKAVYQIA